VRAVLAGAGIGIVYAGIEVAHGDDPSWVFSRYGGVPDLGSALFQVDVLGEYRRTTRRSSRSVTSTGSVRSAIWW
jgi:hypothetical protein